MTSKPPRLNRLRNVGTYTYIELVILGRYKKKRLSRNNELFILSYLYKWEVNNESCFVKISNKMRTYAPRCLQATYPRTRVNT